jgi:hypothetical protein
MLEGNASEFSSHVDKRVQVTGTMASGSSPGADPSGAGAAASGASSSSSSTAMVSQRIRVSSVREVGGDCSASAR